MTPDDETGRTAPPGVDTSRPSIARVYDLLLGGKDNFAVDRELYDRVVELQPDTPLLARANRAWLIRVVRWLAGTAGIRQFLDVGSGLPTAQNTHQVAQVVDPAATVVYVDNDPAVLAFGRALLEENDRTHFAAADLTDPAALLASPEVARYLELDRPLALIQCFTFQHVDDDARAAAIMREYVDALAPGSYVALSHPVAMPSMADAEGEWRQSFASVRFRTHEQILDLVPGLEPVEPGLVPVHDWWPTGPEVDERPAKADHVVGIVARKP